MEDRDELIEQISYSWLEGMSMSDLEQFYLEHTYDFLQSLNDEEFKALAEDYLGD
jgi:hypothetical protein